VAPVPDVPGYYTVTIDQPGHYACTVELQCPEPTPSGLVEELLGTGTQPGALREPVCPSGYVSQADFVCVEGEFRLRLLDGTLSDTEPACIPTPYEPEIHFFRLTHCARMDYGWRIKEIQIYADRECTEEILDGGASPVTIRGEGPPAYPSANGIDFTSDLLRDSDMDTAFWSKCLNCNPYTLDETHGGAVMVDFTTQFADAGSANHDIQCVKVTAKATDDSGDHALKQYFPCCAKLFRGWNRVDDFASSGMIDPSGFTEVWSLDYNDTYHSTVPGYTLSSDSGDAACDTSLSESCSSVARFVSICGEPDLHILAELITIEPVVPSACHCKQLCIDNIAIGCSSWRYRTSNGECHLQRERTCPVEEGSESEPSGTWIAGTTGLRITSIQPERAPVGSFALTLIGVNFPTANDLYEATTPDRQRMKLVAADDPAACAEADVPSSVHGIGCATPMICAPKPLSFSSTSVVFDGISVDRMSLDVEYRICYSMGHTYDRYEWHEAAQRLVVPGTGYVWSTTAAVTAASTHLTLKIERPAFSDYTDASRWQLRLLPAGQSCSSVQDGASNIELAQGNTVVQRNAASVSNTLDSATWTNIPLVDGGHTRVADRYQICFKNGVGAFVRLPSKDERLELEIAEPAPLSHEQAVFLSQRFSGRTGTTLTMNVKGYDLDDGFDSHRVSFISSKQRLSQAPDWGLGESETDGSCGTPMPGDFSFDPTEYTVDSRTSEALTFSVPIPTDAIPGQYDVCLCTSNCDGFTGSSQRNRIPPPASRVRKTAWHADYQEYNCEDRCDGGCVGETCYCEAWGVAPTNALTAAQEWFQNNRATVQGTADERAQFMCAPPRLCAEAARMTTGVSGVAILAEYNLCVLAAAGGNPPVAAKGWSVVVPARPSQRLGDLTVSRRPFVDGNWVLDPEAVSSIEVVGEMMNATSDRIMLISCDGVCGLSQPVQEAVMAEDSTDVTRCCDWKPPNRDVETANAVEFFNEWTAVPPAAVPELPAAVVPYVYNEQKSRYCPGNDINVSESIVSQHRCFHKCGQSSCVGDDCFCDGYLVGHDDSSSNSLCLDRQRCLDACSAMGDDCYGVDMEKNSNRCFLNGPVCRRHVFFVENDRLHPDYHYDFWYRRDDSLQPAEAGRRRALLEVQDAGASWDQILRFPQLAFRTAGSFKVCFCDHETLSSDSGCTSHRDYLIDVGTAHVSGVSCLVEKRQFHRGVCCPQYWGGFRCYARECPSVQVPGFVV